MSKKRDVPIEPDDKTKLLDAVELDEGLASDLLDFKNMRDRALRGDLDATEHVPFTLMDEFKWKGKSITHKQKLFVMSFLEKPGETGEYHARKAGYYDPSRAQYEMLRNPAVVAALRHGARYLGMRFSMTQSSVMGELAAVVHSDLADVATWDASGNVRLKADDEIPSYKRKALKGITQTVSPNGTVTTKIEMHDKNPALQLAARILQMDKKPSMEDVVDAVDMLALARRRAIEAKKREKEEEVIETEYTEHGRDNDPDRTDS